MHKIVIFASKSNIPTIKRFHFFFPCWDINYILHRYHTLKIKKLGFSCDEKILENPLMIRNMENNLDWWD